MYLSQRAALVRNVSIAGVNGGVTLIILLIAPLGLAAVIINTILVTLSTFITASAADRVVLYLAPKPRVLDPELERQAQELVTSRRERR